jgi:dihydroorotase
MSSRTWIRGARHWRGGDLVDVSLDGAVIGEVTPAGARTTADDFDRVVDARGAVLAPGLVDLHVHLREPGQSSKETIETGTRAAAAGGFTAIACMPNTAPVVDNPGWVAWVIARAREAGHCRVHPIGAVTVGQKGEQLAEMLAMREAGAVAFSDDGRPIMSAEIMRRGLEYLRHTGAPIVCHEEDLTLRGQGHMHEGPPRRGSRSAASRPPPRP